MALVLLSAYFAALGALALFGVHRLVLTRAATRARRADRTAALPPAPPDWPPLLVQLPVYNEACVIERLLESAARLRYPGPLEIQVLDDSTDLTRSLAQRKVSELERRGVPIRIVRRPDRLGYKAGALAYGLEQSRAPLVAIFDADFVPPPDFLERSVPRLLSDPGCGMVQARWGHLNPNASWLTRAQAIFLDAHFGIEHAGRAYAGHCFNFNGTAGVWRREAIEAAGGWSHDTITEDLDLSYRAQLMGWRFAYLDDLLVPAELPDNWNAFRSQQSRWVRGSVETLRKLGPTLLAAAWSPRKKLEALIHMASNFAYPLMGLIAVLLPAAVVARDQMGWQVPGGQWLLSALDISMLTAGTLAMIVFYSASIRMAPADAYRGRALDLLFALCVGAGLSLSNGYEAIAGLVSRRSEFLRTPKRGELDSAASLVRYSAPSGLLRALAELAFASYFAMALVYAVFWSLWASMPFLLLYFVGFSSVSVGALREIYAQRLLEATRDMSPSALPPENA